MTRSRSDVTRRLAEHSAEIRALGVERLELFGSVARDEAGPQSDVDLLVRFREGEKTYDNFVGLADLLDRLLGGRVELVTPEGLSPHIGPRILRETRDVPLGP